MIYYTLNGQFLSKLVIVCNVVNNCDMNGMHILQKMSNPVYSIQSSQQVSKKPIWEPPFSLSNQKHSSIQIQV